MEKLNKVNSEEMKRHQAGNYSLNKQAQAVTVANKKYEMEISRQTQEMKLVQQLT